MCEERGREPEIAAYVAGELSPRRRRRFEAHLIECETCWREVRRARAGRRLAESLRELAPATLREDVRAAVGLSPGARRPKVRAGTLGAVAVAVALTVAVITAQVVWRTPSQPAPIEAAMTVFRYGAVEGSGPVDPHGRAAPSLSTFGLELRSDGPASLGSIPANAFVYSSDAGSVALFVSRRDFPDAAGARTRNGMAGGWTARDGSAYLACGSRPVPYLLIGTDIRLLGRIEAAIATGTVRLEV